MLKYFLILLLPLQAQIYVGANVDQFLKSTNKTINLVYLRGLFIIEKNKFVIVNSTEQFKTDFTFGQTDYEVLQRNFYQSVTYELNDFFALGLFHNATYAEISSVNTVGKPILYDYHYSFGVSVNFFHVERGIYAIDANIDIGHERNLFDSEVMIYPKLTVIYDDKIQFRVWALYDFKNKISTVAANVSWKVDFNKILKNGSKN